MNNSGASSKARVGVVFQNVAGITLRELGFDIREGSLCTAKGPRFVVVTSDGTTHSLSGGCNSATAQPAPAKGWQRYRFDPAQARPAIASDASVKSITLVLDDGPDTAGGLVVLDNLDVNGTLIGNE